jgi:hypothetical protein
MLMRSACLPACCPVVYHIPALLKDNKYKMPLAALAFDSGSSTGPDQSCCYLDYDYTGLFPDDLFDRELCAGASPRATPRLVDSIINQDKFNWLNRSGGSSSSSKASQSPSVPAPAADGKAGSAARTERYHGSRNSEDNQGYYEGIAMVVSGPMYIANWDTQQDWEVTGMRHGCCGLMVNMYTVRHRGLCHQAADCWQLTLHQ